MTDTVIILWWVNLRALWIRLRRMICNLLGSVRDGARAAHIRQGGAGSGAVCDRSATSAESSERSRLGAGGPFG